MRPVWQKVRGNSMSPTLLEGDDVLFVPVLGQLAIGHVVVSRRPGGGLLIHRVVAMNGDEIVTRGDACPRDDPPVSRRQILLRAALVRRHGNVSPIPPPAPFPGLRRFRSRLVRLLTRLRRA
jgi:signal peptidase I